MASQTPPPGTAPVAAPAPAPSPAPSPAPAPAPVPAPSPAPAPAPVPLPLPPPPPPAPAPAPAPVPAPAPAPAPVRNQPPPNNNPGPGTPPARTRQQQRQHQRQQQRHQNRQQAGGGGGGGGNRPPHQQNPPVPVAAPAPVPAPVVPPQPPVVPPVAPVTGGAGAGGPPPAVQLAGGGNNPPPNNNPPNPPQPTRTRRFGNWWIAIWRNFVRYGPIQAIIFALIVILILIWIFHKELAEMMPSKVMSAAIALRWIKLLMATILAALCIWALTRRFMRNVIGMLLLGFLVLWLLYYIGVNWVLPKGPIFSMTTVTDGNTITTYVGDMSDAQSPDRGVQGSAQTPPVINPPAPLQCFPGNEYYRDYKPLNGNPSFPFTLYCVAVPGGLEYRAGTPEGIRAIEPAALPGIIARTVTINRRQTAGMPVSCKKMTTVPNPTADPVDQSYFEAHTATQLGGTERMIVQTRADGVRSRSTVASAPPNYADENLFPVPPAEMPGIAGEKSDGPKNPNLFDPEYQR